MILAELTLSVFSTFSQFGETSLSILSELARLFTGFDFIPSFNAQIADNNGGEFRGAVGNVVAAYLQTKGLIDQAKIITDFKDSLDTIAALFWLFSIALAIGAFAVFGNYRQGIYLLIGPALFMFMIESTADTNGTQLRFGDYTKDNSEAEQHEMLDWIKAIDPGDKNKTVKVSRFFATWDAITSEATQSVVKLILKTNEKEHLLMVARERALNFLLHSSSDHPGMIRLIGAVFRGECGQSIPDIQRAHQILTKAPVELYDRTSQKIGVQRFKAHWENDFHALDSITKGFLISMRDGGVKGFEDVKITDPSQPHNASCKQIWGYVSSAAQYVAKRRGTVENFMAYYQAADAGEQPLEEAIEDAKLYLAKKKTGIRTQADDAYDMIAVQVLKNSSDRTTFGALTSQVFGRSPSNSSDHEEVTRIIAKAEGHSGFMKIVYFANAVPYVQGFLLYALSIAFPFFAVFLVVPSRATSFLAWMGMWAWVKSWDVGFAAVHVVRKIMWDIMSRRSNVFDTNINWDDPVTVIAAMFNNDPFSSQNAYFMVVSTVTLAIPFVTAHFFLGATGLFDMFSGTIDQTADRFGSVTENKRSRRFIANVNERAQRLARYNTQLAYAKESMRMKSHDNKANHGENAQSQQQDGSSADLSRIQGTDSNYEGAGTMSGRPVVDAQYADASGAGISSSRARNFASHFLGGDLLAQVGDKSFTNGLVAGRRNAMNGRVPAIDPETNKPKIDPNTGEVVMESNNQGGYSHIMRGMVPLTQEVSREALVDMYGDNEVTDQLLANKTTWSDVFHMSSQYQIDNQALTAAETGRRMMQPTRVGKQGAGWLNQRMGDSEYTRSNHASLNVAGVPFAAKIMEETGVIQDLDIERPNPNTEAFFSSQGKKK